MKRFFPGYNRWCLQRHLLNKMSLRDLNVAYFTYPAIQVYMVLCATSMCVAIVYLEKPILGFFSAITSVFVYPIVWYFLHRFLLHGHWLYKSPRTALLWKRIHFDHHQNPHDLAVLFGGLYTTLPTIFVVTVPLGWLIAGITGAEIAFSAGLATTCFYEYCHCIQHLSYRPKLRFLERIKQLHLAHHYHNEKGNFGITNFACDRVFSTFYKHSRQVPRSSTVRNLGYTGNECNLYPWVAALTRDSFSTNKDHECP